MLVRTSRRMSTTTTLAFRLGGTGRRPGILVDPCWDADELDAIADELDALEVIPAAGFATHAHHDHLLWHPRFGADVVRWASAGTVQMVEEHGPELLEQLLAGRADRYPREVLDLFQQVAAVPDVGAADRDAPPGPHRLLMPDPDGVLPRAEVVVHDGHAPGHSALWLPETAVLVAGDMLSDVELPLPFYPDDLDAYLAGLDLLEPYVRAARVVVPGHGTPSDRPLDRLDADRRYLDAVLADRDPNDPRLDHPGMAEEHAHLRRLAAERSGRGAST